MGHKLKDLDSSLVIDLKSGDIIGRIEGQHTFPETQKISRSHCQFILENNIPYILDLNSRNGTFINTKRCEPQTKVILSDGYLLTIGEKKFLFKTEEAPALPGTPISTHVPKESPKLHPALPNRSYHFQYKASTSELVLLVIKNVILTILTLGIYTPYARTNLKKFLWKSTVLDEKPFLFNGNPRALFKSYLFLIGLFLLFGVVSSAIEIYVLKGSFVLTKIFDLVRYAFVLALFIKAKFGAYAYLVNNTTYRGVSFRMNRAASGAHFKQTIIGSLVTFFTLGLYYPFMLSKLEYIKWNNTQYGSLPLRYHPDHKEFALLWYKGFILTVLTLGIYASWFMISLHQYKIDHLKFGNNHFQTKTTGSGYLVVNLKSLLLFVLTFGLAAPYIFNLNIAYFLDNLSLKGQVNFDEILQASKMEQGELSDAMADLFDLDLDIA